MLNYKVLTPAVERAAGIAKSKFPAHHDLSDVKQEIWAWIMENRTSVARMMDRENDASDKALFNLLVKVGQTYLQGEDAAVYGYDPEDAFNYSLDLIKSILEVVFIHEDWQSFAQAAQDGMPRRKSEPATSGNNLASYADVSRAITSLPEDQYNLLVWRYKYHETYTQIGEHLGLSRQAAQQRHEVAVSAIQQFLGKRDLAGVRNPAEVAYRPGNAASAARTERYYEG